MARYLLITSAIPPTLPWRAHRAPLDMSGTYNDILVLISFLVATIAAYVALSMAGRINASSGSTARWWLAGGACAMGFGIWSMHFIGMLAFRLPIAQGYDLMITVWSLLIAMGASGYALWMVTRPTLPLAQLLGGGTILGCGIAAMHYVGMAAMRIQPGIDYDPLWFSLSVLIAVAAAIAALWISFMLRGETRAHLLGLRLTAAGVMGLAIAGTHYSGMAAARFAQGSLCGAAVAGVSTHWLASLVGTSTFGILGIALVTSVLDRRLQERTMVLASSLEKANSELTHLALHDGLTRLPNRVLLEDRLIQAIENARRSKRRFAVMFIDLDGFKGINDAYGHQVGDQLLLQLSASLLKSVRPEDTVARMGGDEFVILSAIDTIEDAALIAHRVLQLASQPLQLERTEVAVSASIGLAIYPENGLRAQDLLANADAAMYAVKGRGRNGYRLFEPDMNKGAHERVALTLELRHAIQRTELFLDYQPKFCAQAGSVTGVEALVRWRHPRRGLIMPNDFIALAERSGMIIELGRWVMEEACRQLAQWRADGYRLGSVAVNLSPTQFRSGLLYEDVRSTLARHQLPPASLVLEITESTAMQDPETSLEILRRLSTLGVKISIDDFGTGYSSLMYLKKLPASELKIDRGFVRELTSGTDDIAIVSAIVALGRTLDLDVVAEGVETLEQQRLLTLLGCTSLQGYLLGRPGSPDTVCQAFERLSPLYSNDSSSRQADVNAYLGACFPTPILG